MRARNAAPAAALLALVMLAAGCAAPRPAVRTGAPPEVLWQQHRDKIAAISGWRVKGKIAVQSGNEGGSARLLWTRRGEHEQIELSGPLGGGRMRIEASPGRALLRDTEGGRIEAESADAALRERLGWRVPFGELAHWARGLPGGAREDELEFDAAGRLRALQQGRWRVRYREYARVGEMELPRSIFLTATEEAGEDAFSVKVLLQSWKDLRVGD
ncbi:MAG: lipoprotein insertase outer membrane protein LolB [Gammaproteobacteria bacterium]|nr:lipoprotein insertase outer membrane protein LolB [Gammaproteobacteria bacterium]